MNLLLAAAMVFQLRAFPQASIASPGRPAHIHLTAELTRPEDEALYCPRIVWEWPDETESSYEADCEPYAPGADFPRRWSRDVNSGPGSWNVCARLEKPEGKVRRKACVSFEVN